MSSVISICDLRYMTLVYFFFFFLSREGRQVFPFLVEVESRVVACFLFGFCVGWGSAGGWVRRGGGGVVEGGSGGYGT